MIFFTFRDPNAESVHFKMNKAHRYVYSPDTLGYVAPVSFYHYQWYILCVYIHERRSRYATGSRESLYGEVCDPCLFRMRTWWSVLYGP